MDTSHNDAQLRGTAGLPRRGRLPHGKISVLAGAEEFRSSTDNVLYVFEGSSNSMYLETSLI